jgi:hypothetical protein
LDLGGAAAAAFFAHERWSPLGARERGIVVRRLRKPGCGPVATLADELSERIADDPERWAALVDWLERARAFRAWLGDVETVLDPVRAEDVVRRLGLAPLLRPTAADHARDLAAAMAYVGFLLAEAAAQGKRLGAVLDERLLLRSVRQAAGDLDDAVALLTLHAAKGLEFRCVFIAGCNEGLLPLGAAARDWRQEAEERRLFFVGLTRAQDDLELSWLADPQHHAATGEPSRFIGLLPPASLVRYDRGAPAPAATIRPPPGAPVAPRGGEDRALSAWTAGQRVAHPKYGRGTIVRVEGGQVVCTFAVGEKSFAGTFCPLTAEPGESGARATAE